MDLVEFIRMLGDLPEKLEFTEMLEEKEGLQYKEKIIL